MTHPGWSGQGDLPSGNQTFPAGPGANQPGNQYGNQFGQPSLHQPHYGQAQPDQFGQPEYSQTQYGPPYGHTPYGQPPHGQTAGWNGPAPAGFGGQPPAPSRNWLLYGGIGAGVIILALVVALVLQTLGSTSPPPPTMPSTPSTSTPADTTTPSSVTTDADGIPVIPVDLMGKSLPSNVGNFETPRIGSTLKQRTQFTYSDRTVSPTVSVLGTYTNSDIASSILREMRDVQRVGNFLCGTDADGKLHYCLAKVSDGTLLLFANIRVPISTIETVANGVVTGAQ